MIEMINLPKIGDIITTQKAIELCRFFELNDLADRIEGDPTIYKPWKFDGCSCIPDQLLGLFTDCEWKVVTFQCCLPHDLQYAYGEPENEEERMNSDLLLRNRLIKIAKMEPWLAEAFHTAVRLGGSEKFGLSFSWGFARL